MSAQTQFAAWNALSTEAAAAEILPCNGSHAWAKAIAEQRPFTIAHDLFKAADNTWWKLPEQAWQQAFDSHPRLGERHAKAASATSLHWSAGEQSGMAAQEDLKLALEQANLVYEARFGRIFIVCATGKSTAEMLTILHTRLANDPATELREAGEQQRRITHLRLRKWLGLPALRCEDV